MMRRWTRWSAAVVGALAVLALGSVTVDGGAAGAVDGTTVTVTPATGVHDGQSVTVTITGSPDATHTVSICDRAYLDHLDDVLAPLRYCATDSGTYVTRTGTPGQPLTVPVVVRQAPTVLQGSVHCGDEPNDCVVVDWAGYDGSFSVPDPAKVTATPIDVSPTDMLVVTPHLDLPPAATVGVTGAFFQPGAVTVQ
jgi:hypothetical protein